MTASLEEPMTPRRSLIDRLLRVLGGDASGPVFRNMLILATGAGIARIVGIISIPVLTRLYSPDDFGLLAVYASLVAVIVPFGTLRYSLAVPLPKTDRAAVNLVVLSLTLLMAFATILLVGLWLLGPILLPMLSAEELLPYWWVLVVGMVSQGLYEVASQWATRKKAFKTLARSQLAQALTGNGVKIALALLGLRPFGLLIGQLFQQGGGILLLCRDMFRDVATGWGHVSSRRLGFLLARYVDFPKFRLPSQFLLAFSTQGPVLFSASLFGAATTGQLSLAILSLAIPMQLLGTSTGSAYLAEIAAIGRRDPDKVQAITIAVLKRLIMLSVLPCLVLLLYGEQLFVLLLGHQWTVAGSFASALSISLTAQFVSSPVVHVMSVFNRQDLYLWTNLARAGGVIVTFYLAHALGWSAWLAVAVYSALLTVHYCVVVLQTLSVIHNHRVAIKS